MQNTLSPSRSSYSSVMQSTGGDKRLTRTNLFVSVSVSRVRWPFESRHERVIPARWHAINFHRWRWHERSPMDRELLTPCDRSYSRRVAEKRMKGKEKRRRFLDGKQTPKRRSYARRKTKRCRSLLRYSSSNDESSNNETVAMSQETMKLNRER